MCKYDVVENKLRAGTIQELRELRQEVAACLRNGAGDKERDKQNLIRLDSRIAELS